MDLDLTLFVQLALLVLLVQALEGLLFKPLLRVIDTRQQKIYGTRSEVERLEHLGHADRSAYEDRMRRARRQAQAEREAQRVAGRAEARELLAAARAEIAAAAAAARQQVEASERAARAELVPTVGGLAAQLAGKLLGRPVAP